MRASGASGNGPLFSRSRGAWGFFVRLVLSFSARFHFFLGLLLIHWVLLKAGPVAAQLSLESEPVTPSDPEPPRLHFTPSLTAVYEYDDNILLRAVLRESDFITLVTPGFNLLVEQERVKWVTDLKVEFAFYRDHPELSTWDRYQNLSTLLTLRPSNVWTFEFGDVFTHSNDPTRQLDLLLRRAEYYTNILDLKGSYRISPRLTLDAEAVDRITDFRDPLLVDVNEDDLGGGFSYRLTPLDTISAKYQYRNFEFENRGHTETHTVSGKEQHRFTETLTAEGTLGVIGIVDRGTTLNYLLIGAGIEQRYSATAVFRADFLRDVSVVGGLSGTFITNTLSGSVTFHVTQRFDSILAGSWSLQQPVILTRSDIDTLGLRIEEQIRITSWLKGVANYSYFRQNFHDEGVRDIYNNRVFIGLTAYTTYPPP